LHWRVEYAQINHLGFVSGSSWWFCTFAAVKRLIIFILSFVYLSACAGVKVNLFYCCGQLETISLFEQQTSDDCKGSTEKDCCDNRSALLKIKGEQKSTTVGQFEFKSTFVNVLPAYTLQWLPSVTEPVHRIRKTLSNSSPPHYVLYCVHRI